jgi:hypothetical protein
MANISFSFLFLGLKTNAKFPCSKKPISSKYLKYSEFLSKFFQSEEISGGSSIFESNLSSSSSTSSK